MEIDVIRKFSEQEKIVEFEIPVFENEETCVVTDFEDNDVEELDVEIPTFMRG